jgi:hypothetical protein
MTARTMQAVSANKILRKYAAVPSEHGSWVFLFSPLLIGITLGQAWNLEGELLAVTALAGFMLRQPVTLLVKVFSWRRPRSDLAAGLFWAAVYALIGAVSFALLASRGYGYLAYLAVPAVITLAWHLWLVSQRSERRQPGVEIIASGTLALAAPAVYWISAGEVNTTGWWLWALCWLQAANSIVYAYLRLNQRVWKTTPDLRGKLKAAWRPIAYTTFSLAAVATASGLGYLPRWIFLAFAVQWIESLWGAVQPAVGVKPTLIGFRQLIVSVIFTVVFLISWR